MTTARPEIVETKFVAGQSDGPRPLALTERLPAALRLSRATAIFVAVLGALFWRLSFRPLWHTDIWGHLTYGELIWQTGALPATEPLMPLAAGMPLVDTAWLSQLIGYSAFRAWGVVALQFLFALAVTTSLALLSYALYQRTGSVVWSLAGAGIFFWLNTQQWLVGWPEAAALLRPQLAGVVCFACLFVLLASRRERRSDWWTVPALFVLWANLHGSFVMGLLLLASVTAGRAIDLWRRTGSPARAVADRKFWRGVLLTELAATAVLVNPYGIGLYAEVLSFSSNPNLLDLVEWDPLGIRSNQGQAAACAALALAIVFRFSPRRIKASEFLLLVGLGAWTLWTSRMLVWWSLPAAYTLALHGHAAWRKFRRNRPQPAPAPRSGLWSAVTVGLVWIFFAGSAFGVRVLHGAQRTQASTVSRGTPVGAAAYLVKHPPVGQIFNLYEWGDYLGWSGPPGLRIFVNSHAHLVPRDVWLHYLTIASASSGWEDLLDRYGVNTIVVDPAQNQSLISQLREKPAWKVSYEDGTAAIFTRRQPILGGTQE